MDNERRKSFSGESRQFRHSTLSLKSPRPLGRQNYLASEFVWPGGGGAGRRRCRCFRPPNSANSDKICRQIEPKHVWLINCTKRPARQTSDGAHANRRPIFRLCPKLWRPQSLRVGPQDFVAAANIIIILRRLGPICHFGRRKRVHVSGNYQICTCGPELGAGRHEQRARGRELMRKFCQSARMGPPFCAIEFAAPAEVGKSGRDVAAAAAAVGLVQASQTRVTIRAGHVTSAGVCIKRPRPPPLPPPATTTTVGVEGAALFRSP